MPPTTDTRTLPQTLSLESVHGAEAKMMLERIARWRVRYPAIHARFWVPRVQKPVCVLCGWVGPYLWKRRDGQAIANISVITAADSQATRAMVAGGPHALFHQPIEDGEVWFGWCTRCTAPTTPEGWDAVIETVQRRAAGA